MRHHVLAIHAKTSVSDSDRTPSHARSCFRATSTVTATSTLAPPSRLAGSCTLMRSSCPVEAIDGLCVEVTREKTLGRVLPRAAKDLALARTELAAATSLLATASASRDELEAPLAVTASELASARRVLSLLLGDLRAEAALSTRPPASYDPERSQLWLTRRTAEVQQMQADIFVRGFE